MPYIKSVSAGGEVQLYAAKGPCAAYTSTQAAHTAPFTRRAEGSALRVALGRGSTGQPAAITTAEKANPHNSGPRPKTGIILGPAFSAAAFRRASRETGHGNVTFPRQKQAAFLKRGKLGEAIGTVAGKASALICGHGAFPSHGEAADTHQTGHSTAIIGHATQNFQSGQRPASDSASRQEKRSRKLTSAANSPKGAATAAFSLPTQNSTTKTATGTAAITAKKGDGNGVSSPPFRAPQAAALSASSAAASVHSKGDVRPNPTKEEKNTRTSHEGATLGSCETAAPFSASRTVCMSPVCTRPIT